MKARAIVAFLDVFGFSGDIIKFWSDKDSSPLHKILRLKERSTIPCRVGSLFPGTGILQIHNARIHTISDTVLLCHALPYNCSNEHFASALFAVFTKISTVWSHAIEVGYTIRGSVESGDIYWSPTETIGPALIYAYCLELKIARWSRVICGPSLLKRMLLSEGALSLANFGMFDVGTDGLIEVNHFEVYDQNSADIEATKAFISDLERIREHAGPRRSNKYDPILSKLRQETPFLYASKSRIDDAIVQLRMQSIFPDKVFS